MQLNAVIVPPAGVVEDALGAAQDLVASSLSSAQGGSPGMLGRLLGRRAASARATPTVTLSPLAPEAVWIRLAKFGNVAGNDAAGLTTALRAAVRTWPVPVLHVSKVSVAEAAPYEVVAEVDGDTDALEQIFANVNEVARLQRFFLDRRSFRCEFSLGEVTTTDGSSVPDDVIATSLERTGENWSPTHITLLRTTFTGGQTTHAEFARIDLPDVTPDLGAHTGA